MPRAPKGAAAPAVEEAPFAGADPAIDLTIGAVTEEEKSNGINAAPITLPDGDLSVAVEDAEGAPVPAGASEAAGDAPEATTTPPKKAGRAPRKAAATRTNPKAVEGKPDASLPGGEAKRALLDFGTLDEAEDFLNVLWYGPEGVGKTTAALKAANHGRVLVVSAEGGLKAKALKRNGIDISQVTVWPPAGQEDLLTRAGVEALGYKLREDLAADPTAWYAVVWDSGSAIGDKILRQIVAAEVEKDSAKPAHLRKDFRADPYFTDRSDYGTLSSQLVPLIHQYRDLQCHFLITALERRDVDDDTGQVMYGPVFTPAVSSEARASADVVIRVSQEEGDGEMVVVGATRPNPRYRGKDRFGATPIRFADPSFTRVLGYVEGEIDEQNDPIQNTLPATVAAKASGKIKKD